MDPAKSRGRGLSIQYRIVLPYAVLMLLVFGVVGYVALANTAEAARRFLHGQMEKSAATLSQSGFPWNRQSLLRMEKLLGVGGIIAYGPGGGVLASSLDSRAAEEFVAAVGKPPSTEEGVDFKTIETSDGRWYVARKTMPPASAGAPAGVLLVYPPDVVDREVSTALRPMIIAGLAGIALALVVGLLIAKSIAAPIRRLVDAAREVRGEGRTFKPPRGGGPEVSELAGAISAMNASLDQYREKMVRSEKMATLGLVATSLAHEIKNPLAGIRMSVEMLKKTNSDPQVEEEYDIILSEIERLSFTLTELLIFARPPEIRPEKLDPVAAVEGALDIIKRQTAHLGIKVIRDFPDNNASAYADPSAVKQIVLNLALNAVEAMPQGGEALFSLRVEDDSWTLEVADAGKGFDNSDGEDIYEPFFTTKPGGTGLGLSVCRTLVKLHGGEIRARPGEKGGALFTVVMPVKPETKPKENDDG